MYRLYLNFFELNMTTSFKYFETDMKQIKTILCSNRNKTLLAVHENGIKIEMNLFTFYLHVVIR